MSDDDQKASDRLYYGVEALKGWDGRLQEARDPWRQNQPEVGAILSTILLAAGEDSEPLAVSGELDEAGKGELTVVYDGFFVSVIVADVTAPPGSAWASVYGFDQVTSLDLVGRHNYFSGVEGRDRHVGTRVRVVVGGHALTLAATPWSRNPLSNDAAIFDAYERIRDARIRTK